MTTKISLRPNVNVTIESEALTSNKKLKTLIDALPIVNESNNIKEIDLNVCEDSIILTIFEDNNNGLKGTQRYSGNVNFIYAVVNRILYDLYNVEMGV